MTDLAPRLDAYYGEPGVKEGVETDLFLVGDHFNVHETHVIAGNVEILPTSTSPQMTLLSRQIMKVGIPSNVIPVGNSGTIDVLVVTPYGVSDHLEIPFFAKSQPLWNVAPDTITVNFAVAQTNQGPCQFTAIPVEPPIVLTPLATAAHAATGDCGQFQWGLAESDRNRSDRCRRREFSRCDGIQPGRHRPIDDPGHDFLQRETRRLDRRGFAGCDGRPQERASAGRDRSNGGSAAENQVRAPRGLAAARAAAARPNFVARDRAAPLRFSQAGRPAGTYTAGPPISGPHRPAAARVAAATTRLPPAE